MAADRLSASAFASSRENLHRLEDQKS